MLPIFISLLIVFLAGHFLGPVLLNAYRRSVVDGERQRLAEQRGWRFRLEDRSLLTRWRGHPFSIASKALSVVEGHIQDFSFMAFDCQYIQVKVMTSGQIRYRAITVWVLQLPQSVPSISVTSTSMLGRMLSEWIDPENLVRTVDPEFDRHYAVRTNNVHADLLTPAMRASIRAIGSGHWHTHDRHLLFWRGVGGTSCEQLVETAEQLAVLARQFPGITDQTFEHSHPDEFTAFSPGHAHPPVARLARRARLRGLLRRRYPPEGT